MRKHRAWLGATTTAAVCVAFGAAPALAAAPTNDAYADAAPVESLPFVESRDIGGAGAEGLETLGSCAQPRLPRNYAPNALAQFPSVWYRFQPADDVQITIDTSASDFVPMVVIYEGDDLVTQEEVACRREGALTADLRGGTSYAIQILRGGGGSSLELAIERSDLPGVAEIVPFQVAADDGTQLRGHVYLPEGDGPFAPVLEYSPYWNTAYGPSESFTEPHGDRLTMAAWLGPLMDAGFAVALVNMRGTGESGGCYQQGGSVDWGDAAVVIEALADAEWSTGKVGMYGLSAPGRTQFMAIASHAAPSLEAVVPVSGTTDPWNTDTAQGATEEDQLNRDPVFTAQATTGTFQTVNRARETDTPFVPDTDPGHFPCPRYSEEVEHSPPLWNGDRTEYYRERDLRPHIEGTDVAVFATVGLHAFQGVGGHDWEGAISQLDGIWELLGGDRRFMLGQWGHGFPTRPDFHRMAVAWLDQHLRGGNRGGPGAVKSGVVEYQDDGQVWHTAREWPPPAEDTKLWLSGDDLVTGRGRAETSSRRFLSTDRVPCAGACLRPFAARVPDCSLDDQLVYVSEPLAGEVVVAGHYAVDLTLESTLPDGTLTSFLFHTDADDPCAAGQVAESGHAVTDLRHIFVDEGAEFPVDTPTAVALTSKPLATRIPAGHRLVLTVGSAGWDTEPDPSHPVLTVTTGPGTTSALTLPVVSGELRTAG